MRKLLFTLHTKFSQIDLGWNVLLLFFFEHWCSHLNTIITHCGWWFSGKFAPAFEGFLRKRKGVEEVEFHVERVEGWKFYFLSLSCLPGYICDDKALVVCDLFWVRVSFGRTNVLLKVIACRLLSRNNTWTLEHKINVIFCIWSLCFPCSKKAQWKHQKQMLWTAPFFSLQLKLSWTAVWCLNSWRKWLSWESSTIPMCWSSWEWLFMIASHALLCLWCWLISSITWNRIER